MSPKRLANKILSNKASTSTSPNKKFPGNKSKSKSLVVRSGTRSTQDKKEVDSSIKNLKKRKSESDSIRSLSKEGKTKKTQDIAKDAPKRRISCLMKLSEARKVNSAKTIPEISEGFQCIGKETILGLCEQKKTYPRKCSKRERRKGNEIAKDLASVKKQQISDISGKEKECSTIQKCTIPENFPSAEKETISGFDSGNTSPKDSLFSPSSLEYPVDSEEDLTAFIVGCAFSSSNSLRGNSDSGDDMHTNELSEGDDWEVEYLKTVADLDEVSNYNDPSIATNSREILQGIEEMGSKNDTNCIKLQNDCHDKTPQKDTKATEEMVLRNVELSNSMELDEKSLDQTQQKNCDDTEEMELQNVPKSMELEKDSYDQSIQNNSEDSEEMLSQNVTNSMKLEKDTSDQTTQNNTEDDLYITPTLSPASPVDSILSESGFGLHDKYNSKPKRYCKLKLSPLSLSKGNQNGSKCNEATSNGEIGGKRPHYEPNICKSDFSSPGDSSSPTSCKKRKIEEGTSGRKPSPLKSASPESSPKTHNLRSPIEFSLQPRIILPKLTTEEKDRLINNTNVISEKLIANKLVNRKIITQENKVTLNHAPTSEETKEKDKECLLTSSNHQILHRNKFVSYRLINNKITIENKTAGENKLKYDLLNKNECEVPGKGAADLVEKSRSLTSLNGASRTLKDCSIVLKRLDHITCNKEKNKSNVLDSFSNSCMNSYLNTLQENRLLKQKPKLTKASLIRRKNTLKTSLAIPEKLISTPVNYTKSVDNNPNENFKTVQRVQDKIIITKKVNNDCILKSLSPSPTSCDLRTQANFNQSNNIIITKKINNESILNSLSPSQTSCDLRTQPKLNQSDSSNVNKINSTLDVLSSSNTKKSANPSDLVTNCIGNKVQRKRITFNDNEQINKPIKYLSQDQAKKDLQQKHKKSLSSNRCALLTQKKNEHQFLIPKSLSKGTDIIRSPNFSGNIIDQHPQNQSFQTSPAHSAVCDDDSASILSIFVPPILENEIEECITSNTITESKSRFDGFNKSSGSSQASSSYAPKSSGSSNQEFPMHRKLITIPSEISRDNLLPVNIDNEKSTYNKQERGYREKQSESYHFHSHTTNSAGVNKLSSSYWEPGDALYGTVFSGHCLDYLRTSTCYREYNCGFIHKVPNMPWNPENCNRAVEGIISKDFSNPPLEFLACLVKFCVLHVKHTTFTRIGEALKLNVNMEKEQEAKTIWKVYIENFIAQPRFNKILNKVFSLIFEKDKNNDLIYTPRAKKVINIILKGLGELGSVNENLQLLTCVEFLKDAGFKLNEYPVSFKIASLKQVKINSSTNFLYKIYKTFYEEKECLIELHKADSRLVINVLEMCQNNIYVDESIFRLLRMKNNLEPHCSTSRSTQQGYSVSNTAVVPERRQSNPMAGLISMLENESKYSPLSLAKQFESLRMNAIQMKTIFSIFNEIGSSKYIQILKNCSDSTKESINNLTMNLIIKEAINNKWWECYTLYKNMFNFSPLNVQDFQDSAKTPVSHLLVIIQVCLNVSQLKEAVTLFATHGLFNADKRKWLSPPSPQDTVSWEKLCSNIAITLDNSSSSSDLLIQLYEQIIKGQKSFDNPINIKESFDAFISRLIKEKREEDASKFVSLIIDEQLLRFFDLSNPNHYRILIITLVQTRHLYDAKLLVYKAAPRVMAYTRDFMKKSKAHIQIKSSLSYEEMIAIINCKLQISKGILQFSNLTITFEVDDIPRELLPYLSHIECSILSAMERFKSALRECLPNAGVMSKDNRTLVIDRITLMLEDETTEEARL